MSKETEARARLDLIDAIHAATKALPDSVESATDRCRIYTVLQRHNSNESSWEHFNKSFDALFGAGCLNKETGTFKEVRSGRKGMSNVVTYLRRVYNMPGMLHEPMMIKLESLKKGLEVLVG
jgi:hypothetical protein